MEVECWWDQATARHVTVVEVSCPRAVYPQGFDSPHVRRNLVPSSWISHWYLAGCLPYADSGKTREGFELVATTIHPLGDLRRADE
jgi:hypothetical protein